MPAPLEGIKVIDFTQFQNGPQGTSMLSDMGADVLKIERPGEGDPLRPIGMAPDGYNAVVEAVNRGKSSLTLNLKSPRAEEIIHKLVVDADVVAENFIAGTMDGLGFGYEDLRKINPKLIFATNSGFGPEGPWTERGCYDHVSQGFSGAMISNGGGPGADPVRLIWGANDQISGIILAYGIMTALVARELHGVGQKVDVSLVGAMMTLQGTAISGYLHTREQPRVPFPPPLRPTFSPHKASDGEWFTDGVLVPAHWPKLCMAINRPDLIDDERTKDAWARTENAEWLTEELNTLYATKPRQYWLDKYEEFNVPGGPVYDYAGLVADQQAWDSGYLVEVEHPNFENHAALGIPARFSVTEAKVQGVAPEVGQHTEEALLALGYSWDDINELRDQEVI